MERQKTRAFLLRLCPSLRDEAAELAKSEGISLNHFISLALAERMVRLEATQAVTRDRTAPHPNPGNKTGPFFKPLVGSKTYYNQGNVHTRSGIESG